MKIKNILSVLVLITATLFNNNLNAACNSKDGTTYPIVIKGNQSPIIGEEITYQLEGHPGLSTQSGYWSWSGGTALQQTYLTHKTKFTTRGAQKVTYTSQWWPGMDKSKIFPCTAELTITPVSDLSVKIANPPKVTLDDDVIENVLEEGGAWGFHAETTGGYEDIKFKWDKEHFITDWLTTSFCLYLAEITTSNEAKERTVKVDVKDSAGFTESDSITFKCIEILYDVRYPEGTKFHRKDHLDTVPTSYGGVYPDTPTTTFKGWNVQFTARFISAGYNQGSQESVLLKGYWPNEPDKGINDVYNVKWYQYKRAVEVYSYYMDGDQKVMIGSPVSGTEEKPMPDYESSFWSTK